MNVLKNKVDTSKVKGMSTAQAREALIRQQVPITSKVPSEEYRKNYDRIFKKK